MAELMQDLEGCVCVFMVSILSHRSGSVIDNDCSIRHSSWWELTGSALVDSDIHKEEGSWESIISSQVGGEVTVKNVSRGP